MISCSRFESRCLQSQTGLVARDSSITTHEPCHVDLVSGFSFVDDEKRHYRPQLEMKPELVAEMKKRRVAEARQRKKGRADARLDAAKKKADSIANDTEMSARQKLKAVQSTLAKGKRGLLSDKKSKVYVVAKKTSASGASTSKAKSLDANKGSKVVKVDGRMKMEKRAAKNKVKRGPKRKRS
ncbi:Spb1 C-terminal domain-containing protein [Pelagophyceae sp. CCMP2097]|nr:Spb1 C-terminal domain-containing protein [Pelagophyceae sp. CCMP2097]